MEYRKAVRWLISIIMSTWNTERFIAETIQYVLENSV